MEKRELSVGDLVQINPETFANKMFAATIVVVTEPKSWGCQGYVQMTGENGNPGDLAYIRLKWEDFEYVGHAEWISKT